MIRRPPSSPLFPSPTLSRSAAAIETPLQTAFAGGNPPDGWQADQLWVPVWGAKGFAAPLDDLMKRDKWDKKDRKSTRLNSSHANISYAVFCLKKKISSSATV